MKIIDLTQNINEIMPVYPGTDRPSITNATTIENEGFAEKLIKMYSHTGTHIDAPAHMLQNGSTLDNFNVDKFIGKAIIIDCEVQKITKNLIMSNIEQKGNIDFIILNTGWSSKWGIDDYFYNFPILEADASSYISQLGLKGIGLDCISIDAVGSDKMENHIKIFNSNMIIIENLCNLDQLVNKEFIFSSLPLKIENSDGSPTRAIAILE